MLIPTTLLPVPPVPPGPDVAVLSELPDLVQEPIIPPNKEGIMKASKMFLYFIKLSLTVRVFDIGKGYKQIVQRVFKIIFLKKSTIQ